MPNKIQIEILEKTILKHAIKEMSEMLYGDEYAAKIPTSSSEVEVKNIPLRDVQTAAKNCLRELSGEQKKLLLDGVKKRFDSSKSPDYPPAKTNNDFAYEAVLALLT